MISCEHTLEWSKYNENRPDNEEYSIDIEIVYKRHDDEIEIWEVTYAGEPLDEKIYEKFEEEIIEVAEEHMYSHDAESQYYGNLIDHAYERAREKNWGL